jgi:uncharacterized protein (DUF4415 family)
MNRKSSSRQVSRVMPKSTRLRSKTSASTQIPPLGEEFWNRAVRNPFYRPVKQATTVRIDADVLAWLRAQGKGYQTRINQILRNAMLDGTKK